MTKGPRKALPPPTEDLLPPHAEEAEQGVLGCALLAPEDGIPKLIDHLKEGAEVFYDHRHRQIYDALVDMYGDGHPIDFITLGQTLKDRQQLDGIGGRDYLVKLTTSVPSAANLDYYTEIIRDKFLRRQLIRACQETMNEAFTLEDNTTDLLDRAEHRVLSIATGTVGKRFQSAKSLIPGAMEYLERLEQCGQLSGIPSGYPDLDKLTGGFQKKDLIIIAARPSVGKSALAMNMADTIAVDHRLGVGVLSLEMPAEALMTRMLSSRAAVNIRTLGAKNTKDTAALLEASKVLRKAPIYIDDERGLTMLQARAKGRRMSADHKIQLLIVDYLQLLSAPDYARESRSQEVAAIAKGMKELAAELDIPVMVLCQLNRDIDKDKERPPRLADLFESSGIEQAADVVMMIWKKSKDEDRTSWTNTVGVNVAKQRNGPTGFLELVFNKSIVRFDSVARDEDPQSGLGI